MSKSIFLPLALVFATSTSWATNPTLQITGHSCANPWSGADGPDYHSAMVSADEDANKACYPFQAQRVSDYTLAFNDKICPEHLFGGTATAQYTCAH